MRYENEEQRKFGFTDCCKSIELLFERGYTHLDMFEQYYSHAIGIIAMHQHYDPERAKNILACVREVVLIHQEIQSGEKPEQICSECQSLFELDADNPFGDILYDEGVGVYFTCDECFVLEGREGYEN